MGKRVPPRRAGTAGGRGVDDRAAVPDQGLLAPPGWRAAPGWYDDSHLSRLRLIARLQGEGYSLAGIANLLDQWEQGRSLDAVIGVEAELDAPRWWRHASLSIRPSCSPGSRKGSMTPR